MKKVLKNNGKSLKLTTLGFTVVELIVSFSLTLVIAVFLFQIIINLKNLYTNSVIKTELVNMQSLISREINSKFNNNKIVNITKCDSYCLNFIYENGDNDKLALDFVNKTIQFGSYIAKLPENSSFGSVNIDSSYSATFSKFSNDAMILINIPIYNENFNNENFGVNIVYQYNTSENNIDIPEFK